MKVTLNILLIVGFSTIGVRSGTLRNLQIGCTCGGEEFCNHDPGDSFCEACPKTEACTGIGLISELGVIDCQKKCEKSPLCDFVNENEFLGNSTSIDTDGSGGFIPTTGDISIAVSLVPRNPSSIAYIKAVCILTAKDPTASAPFCTFENSYFSRNGGISGTTIATGTPPRLAITGGTGDFYGAYGEIITGGDFKFEQVERDTIQLSFSVTVSYCIPARVNHIPSPTQEPTRASTRAPTRAPTSSASTPLDDDSVFDDNTSFDDDFQNPTDDDGIFDDDFQNPTDDDGIFDDDFAGFSDDFQFDDDFVGKDNSLSKNNGFWW